jgi:hypothetical protein
MEVTHLKELKGPDPAQIRSRFITQAATVSLGLSSGFQNQEFRI